jgi:hypothetical protein
LPIDEPTIPLYREFGFTRISGRGSFDDGAGEQGVGCRV